MRLEADEAPSFDAVRTLGDLLAWRRDWQADKPAFAFMDQDLAITGMDDFGSLAISAQGVARRLREEGVAGGAVVIACPPGLDFVRALWGVWLAGGVATPCYPPTTERLAVRFARIVEQTGARIVLARDGGRSEVERRLVSSRSLSWIDPALDAAAGGPPPPPAIVDAESPALIQYTSGSSGSPKGVILTHGNILANAQSVYRAFQHTSKSRGLIWLPPYHDMGLMGGVVQPVYGGFRTCLTSPRTFLRNPLNWLRAISLSRATTSGGPNFAYEACLALDEAHLDAADLDLGSWQVAFNGAEPVSASTVVAFGRKFHHYGMKLRHVVSCYGLAESTLLVSATARGRTPAALTVSRSALGRGEVRVLQGDAAEGRVLVSSGRADAVVKIVGPNTGLLRRSGEVGEIWLAGPSVGSGYLRDDETSEAVFRARLDRDGTEYLRTGDLGFLYGGELYVTGRIKDLVIVRGQNHHPEDIEATVRGAHPRFAELLTAVFALDPGGTEEGEELVVVQETSRRRVKGGEETLLAAIRTAVSVEHGVAPAIVVLVARGALPRTPSGKVQRSACRERLISGDLPIVAEWRGSDQGLRRTASTRAAITLPENSPLPDLGGRTTEEVTALLTPWLVQVVAGLTQIPAPQLDLNTHFGLYGLDSLTAAAVAAVLSAELGLEFEDTVLWDYPNFTLFGRHLAERLQESAQAKVGLAV